MTMLATYFEARAAFSGTTDREPASLQSREQVMHIRPSCVRASARSAAVKPSWSFATAQRVNSIFRKSSTVSRQRRGFLRFNSATTSKSRPLTRMVPPNKFPDSLNGGLEPGGTQADMVKLVTQFDCADALAPGASGGVGYTLSRNVAGGVGTFVNARNHRDECRAILRSGAVEAEAQDRNRSQGRLP